MKFAILTLLGHECHACIEATLQQVQAALATPQLTAVTIEPVIAGRWAFTDAQGRKGMVWAVGQDGERIAQARGRKDMAWAVGCASAEVPACTQWSFVGDAALMEHLFTPRPTIVRRAAALLQKVIALF